MQADVDERWNTASNAPDMGAESSQSNIFAAAKLDKLSMALLNFCIEGFTEKNFVFGWPNTLSLVRVGPASDRLNIMAILHSKAIGPGGPHA